MNLLDANVWVAAAWERHTAHEKARRWRATASGPLAICRVTQMALLRLLTNRAVMGPDVLTRREAWAIATRLQSDAEVIWLDEPDRLEDLWRTLSSRDDHNHKLWTDDYLAAFALGAGATLVTFDRAFVTRYPSVEVVVI